MLNLQFGLTRVIPDTILDTIPQSESWLMKFALRMMVIQLSGYAAQLMKISKGDKK